MELHIPREVLEPSQVCISGSPWGAGVGQSQDKKHGMLSAPRPEHKGTLDTAGLGTHRNPGHSGTGDTPGLRTHSDSGYTATPDTP